MHIHILGICGTFMGSLAQLAKAAGHSVSGCDANVYPPMSTQLEKAGIVLIEGFDPEQLQPAPDLIVVGNALSRGNPCVEAMLDRRLPYISGPQWLGETILRHKHVLSVAGTHGKTTTSSMLVKILDSAGLEPGFLIGGVPQDTGLSARLSDSDYFVVEADEYDSDTLVINNLEFDHADIFDDLAAIQRQFHHCVRTVPSTGTVIYPGGDENVRGVIERGCWSQQQPFGEHSDWHYQLSAADGSKFDIIHGAARGTVSWQQTGLHNVANGLAAVIAACQVGVSLDQACAGLSDFVGVKRRMELIYQDSQVSVYDDFAHHPTAIKTTIAGLRSKVRAERIIAVIEPRSATMRLGIHKDSLSAAVAEADQVLWYQNPRIDWDINAVAEACPVPAEATDSIESLLALTTSAVDSKTHIVIMSNGGFEGFHSRLTKCLEAGS
jgi:UDP-N-acetylmuramate: L-alanyl-gamma-D-glutamyl-meso-diaminopimelate ligase